MVERIQEILAGQMQDARNKSDIRRAKGLKNLAKGVARADARGWFSNDAPLSQLTERERILAIPDLRERTYELLSLVREPSKEEREVLEKKMNLVILSLEAKPLSKVVAADPNYFWDGELDYVNGKSELRDFTPPALVVAINPDPKHIALHDSFIQSRPTQLVMIEEYSQRVIEKEFPDAKAIMLPATGYAQADWIYNHRPETKSKILFRNFYARALDNTSGVYAADVGRYRPDYRLHVRGWNVDDGLGNVGGVPAVVFLRK